MDMAIETIETIEDLFYRQIKDLTLKGRLSSFDKQFGDRWF